MNNTLVSCLALLISMFALTASFSLSMTPDEDNLSNTEPNEVDQNPWVFEEANYDLTKSCRYEDSNFIRVEKDNNAFANYLHPKFFTQLDSHKEKLFYAFRIYKKKREKEAIIGLIFEKEKNVGELVLYNNNLDILKIPYADTIKNRRLDLSEQRRDFFSSILFTKDEYLLFVEWMEPNQDYKNMKVYCNSKGEIQIDDNTKPIKPKKQSRKKLKKRSGDTNSFLTNFWIWFPSAFLLILLAVHEKYFAKKTKDAR